MDNSELKKDLLENRRLIKELLAHQERIIREQTVLTKTHNELVEQQKNDVSAMISRLDSVEDMTQKTLNENIKKRKSKRVVTVVLFILIFFIIIATTILVDLSDGKLNFQKEEIELLSLTGGAVIALSSWVVSGKADNFI